MFKMILSPDLHQVADSRGPVASLYSIGLGISTFFPLPLLEGETSGDDIISRHGILSHRLSQLLGCVGPIVT